MFDLRLSKVSLYIRFILWVGIAPERREDVVYVCKQNLCVHIKNLSCHSQFSSFRLSDASHTVCHRLLSTLRNSGWQCVCSWSRCPCETRASKRAEIERFHCCPPAKQPAWISANGAGLQCCSTCVVHLGEDRSLSLLCRTPLLCCFHSIKPYLWSHLIISTVYINNHLSWMITIKAPTLVLDSEKHKGFMWQFLFPFFFLCHR